MPPQQRRAGQAGSGGVGRRVSLVRASPAAAEYAAMQSQNQFFDDLARMAAGAAGALTGVRGEIEARFRDQLERVLAGMDMVSREEFEAVKAMAAKAREEQEILLRRIEALERPARRSGAPRGRRTRAIRDVKRRASAAANLHLASLAAALAA